MRPLRAGDTVLGRVWHDDAVPTDLLLGIGLAAHLPVRCRSSPCATAPVRAIPDSSCRVTVDDDTVVAADPQVGLMHRSAEKLLEARDYRQVMLLANRHDWLSAFSSELGVALAIEARRHHPAGAGDLDPDTPGRGQPGRRHAGVPRPGRTRGPRARDDLRERFVDAAGAGHGRTGASHVRPDRRGRRPVDDDVRRPTTRRPRRRPAALPRAQALPRSTPGRCAASPSLARDDAVEARSQRSRRAGRRARPRPATRRSLPRLPQLAGPPRDPDARRTATCPPATRCCSTRCR